MKAKDLREKSTEDLNELLKTVARGVFDSRFKNFTNRLEHFPNHHPHPSWGGFLCCQSDAKSGC